MAEQPPQFYTDKAPFKGSQNVRGWCGVDGCTWDIFGPREQLRHAWNEHYRMNHSQESGVLHYDRRAREELWLPLNAKASSAP